jgi:hypothetical protein
MPHKKINLQLDLNHPVWSDAYNLNGSSKKKISVKCKHQHITQNILLFFITIAKHIEIKLYFDK